MKTNQIFLDKFYQLKKDFSTKLPIRLKEIDFALQNCIKQSQDDDQLQVLYRLLHSLGGTAGSFGLVQLGLEARKIEGKIVTIVECDDRNKFFMQLENELEKLKEYANVHSI
jgi:HPt (histidine-containing phosphotransfer) domain-containing protein